MKKMSLTRLTNIWNN